jgi:hypothetical protein
VQADLAGEPPAAPGADLASPPNVDLGSVDLGSSVADLASQPPGADLAGLPPNPPPVNSADVKWGTACLYNFGSDCPFQIAKECGNHQAIDVSFPNGPQLLNATAFTGIGCSTNALQDNFNDSQTKLGSDIWMFTDDAAVPGVSAAAPSSVIWWVGPLTQNGYPPAGAPTTGCLNYTSATPTCQ